MSSRKQAATTDQGLETALTAQPQRLIDALREESTLDGTPIVQDDETCTCEEYVTLVYELHHVILPALEGAGLVAFDRDSDTVTRGPQFTETHPCSTDSDTQ